MALNGADRPAAREFRLSKGLDLRLGGGSASTAAGARAVASVGLHGSDYSGIRPALEVAVGDAVTLGQPLFHDRHDPPLRFTSPGTGIVSDIAFGERRALQSVTIDLGDESTSRAFAEPLDPATATREAIRDRLLASGLWTAFRTRPFSRVPASGDTPEAIFVTAIDTAPLATDPRAILGSDPAAFRAGIVVLTRLIPGAIYVCRAPGDPLPLPASEQVVDAVFSGPHPAGLPGTHIHHLHPVGAGRTVWHLGCQDVLAIGRLFATGVLDVSRTVALTGAVATPGLVSTRLGASVPGLVGDPDPGLRILSGDVLSGREARGADAWLGRYHQQITVLREPGEAGAFGWLRALLAAVGPRSRAGTTRVHGRTTGMLPVDGFERVLPLDLLPSPLLRALLLRDTESALKLGCLELAEEDLALCAYLCPARQDYGAALRATLDDYRRHG